MLAAAAVVAGAGLLAGCSSGKSYPDAAALKSAYYAAGGVCADSVAEKGSGSLLKGASLVHCDGGSTELIVFPSNDERDAFVSRTVRGHLRAVVGDRWAVLGKDVAQYAEALGGEVRKAS